MEKILIVEDNRGMRDMLRRALTGRYQVDAVGSGEEALERCRDRSYDLIIADLKMPKMDGIELLHRVRELVPGQLVIMMTAHGSIETAVEAMRLGAFDYVEKPFPLEEMEAKVARALGKGRLAPTEAGAPPEGATQEIIGTSEAMREVMATIRRAAPAPSPVLILGESGTGKELVAREVHGRSDHRTGPFVPVNCAALPESLIESELFGHVGGAFTGATGDKKGKFEVAHGGTLFLDEIGDLPLDVQVKILRFLQDKTFERVGDHRHIRVDVRIVAATNQDLKAAVRDGKFREDLYYRIHVIVIQLPPLRDRPEDVPALLVHFLDRFNREMKRSLTIAPEAVAILQAYRWPGNVRELENVLERAVVLAEGNRIEVKDIPQDVRGAVPALAGAAGAGEAGPAADGAAIDQGLLDRVERYERAMILRALDTHAWNQTRAAEDLGLKRSSLQYKMKKYGLKREEG